MPYLVDPVVPAGAMATRGQPTLSGDGLSLRPFEHADAEALMAAFADPDICRWHARSLGSVDEAHALIDAWCRSWADEQGARWAVVDPATGTLAGQAGLRAADLVEGVGEVSYWTVPSVRGRGTASRACAAVCTWAFDELGLHRLELHHAVANSASCAVAKRTGFVMEGTMRDKALHADGWHDMHLHSRLRTDSVDS